MECDVAINDILLGSKKEQITDTYYYMAKPQEYYTS